MQAPKTGKKEKGESEEHESRDRKTDPWNSTWGGGRSRPRKKKQPKRGDKTRGEKKKVYSGADKIRRRERESLGSTMNLFSEKRMRINREEGTDRKLVVVQGAKRGKKPK